MALNASRTAPLRVQHALRIMGVMLAVSPLLHSALLIGRKELVMHVDLRSHGIVFAALPGSAAQWSTTF